MARTENENVRTLSNENVQASDSPNFGQAISNYAEMRLVNFYKNEKRPNFGPGIRQLPVLLWMQLRMEVVETVHADELVARRATVLHSFRLRVNSTCAVTSCAWQQTPDSALADDS